ncbi:12824_t:CDS:2, partial [Funneliformis mosseae]
TRLCKNEIFRDYSLRKLPVRIAAYCKLPSIDSNLPVGIEITLLEVLSRTQCCRRSYTLNAFTTGLSRVHSLLSPQTLPLKTSYEVEITIWTNEGLLKVTLQEDLQLFHNVEVVCNQLQNF